MRQVVVLSGKGGTGKTTVTAGLAFLAAQGMDLVLADADVDAANLELVLDPAKRERHEFWSGRLAVIDPEKCTACGRCAEVCRFDAVIPDERAYQIDALACEGCATCAFQCPVEAIEMVEQQAGCWFRSETRLGALFHAHLFAGQENSGKLVSRVKKEAGDWASDHGADLLLVDGPPGIGCPVIAASTGADLALLVVEPTVAGVHDLQRVLATTEHFRVPALVVINKADLNTGQTERISAFCEERGVPVVGTLSYDPQVTKAMVHGQPVPEYVDGPIRGEFERVWQTVRTYVGNGQEV